MSTDARDVDRVEAALRRWLEEQHYASYDVYDGLSATFPWSLVRRNHLTSRLLMQLVKRSPVNLRPLLGIRKHIFAKSLSDLASAALLRHRLGEDPQARAQAGAFLDRLEAAALPGWSGICWGMPIPYVSRFVQARADDPNLFWTINAATAFLEAYELDGRRKDLEIARSTLDFIREDLGIVDEGASGVWIPYFVREAAGVLNVAALAGALFRRVARYTGEPEWAELGARALHFVMRHQNADGSWPYARSPRGRWVDGFHTAYVLESLLQSSQLDDDERVRRALQRGVEFYVERLFTADFMPRYATDRTYPLDVQNCAQAIQTLAKLAWFDARFLARAEQVAAVVIRDLYRETRSEPEAAGYFVASRGRWIANSLPAVRWGEAPMLLALTFLQAARRGLRPSWELLDVAT